MKNTKIPKVKQLIEDFHALSAMDQADFFNHNLLQENGWQYGMSLFKINQLADALDANGVDFIRKIVCSIDEKNKTDKVQVSDSQELVEYLTPTVFSQIMNKG